jgi:hypothetical protein
MNNIVPFFEVNGVRYEVKKTRWLLAEYQRLQEQSQLSPEIKQNATKVERLLGDLKRYAEKTKELWEKFCETFDDEDERKYLKAKSLYDDTHYELAKLEAETGSFEKVNKAGIDLLERVAIKGVAEQHFGCDEQRATAVWCQFVEENGKTKAGEWLSAMAECLFSDDEEEGKNDFLSQMKHRAEEKAFNRKQGFKKKG